MVSAALACLLVPAVVAAFRLFPKEHGPDPAPSPRPCPDRGHLGVCRVDRIDVMDVPKEEASQVYVCPVCGGRMKIAGVTPRASDLPNLLTFQCLDCNEVITIEDD